MPDVEWAYVREILVWDESKVGCIPKTGVYSQINTQEKSVKPSEALNLHRAEIRRIVAANMATNPRVFGSVVHGDDQDDSDLDILVDALPGATLFDLGGIQFELQELLGVPVDLLTPRDISVKFRAAVLAEAVPV
jgi:uncharacterized protein